MQPNTSTSRSSRGLPRAKDQGVILIVAMLIAAIIAISLGSYINLSLTSLKLANRTFYNNAAMNLAETGVEEALWAFNQATSGTALATAWASPWDTSDGTTGKGTFTNFNLSGNTTGSVKVYVDRYNPPSGVQPTIVSQATITLPGGGATIVKTIEVKLKRRSIFSMGMVAKKDITFSKKASADSYDSTLGAYDAPVVGGGNNKYDRVAIGSVSVKKDAVDLGEAAIWGYVSVGGSNIDKALDVDKKSIIGAFGTPVGTIDYSRVTTDFTSNFPVVTAPTGFGFSLGEINSSATIGVAGATTPTTYYITSIKLDKSDDLNIIGPVILVISGKIEMKGNAGFNILPTASAIVYAGDDVKIGGTADFGGTGEDLMTGKGITNPNGNPASLQIYGVDPKAKISIKGNGSLTAVVYSPDAEVKISGHGDVFGSFVGEKISVKGLASFHYDEALSNFGPNNSFGLNRWRELTSSTDRAAYTTQLSF